MSSATLPWSPRTKSATLARVRALRSEIVETAAAAHDGRLFKTMGDGFLLEFASAVQALQCAIAIQTTLNAQTEGLRLRIGVHQGEVVPEGDDLFGDGVIIAARLEPLAEHGGIVISSRVKEDASGKMTLEVDDLGEPELKNISAKIRVYRVRLSEAERSALPIPDKPSLVVLPFQNMSGDPEQEYFADGMVEEITTAISRLPWLFVIARNSAFTYKGRAVDVKQVARELGVRYVLEGSVRKAGQRVRIAGQLIDTTTGSHIWADRFDGALDDIFDLQDRVASAVAGAIEPKLRLSEIERAARKPTDSLGAYDLYLRALPQSYSYGEASFAAAVALLRQALAIDPDYAPAAALLGFCRTQQQAQGWGALWDADLAESVRLARQALKAARDDAETLWHSAWVLFRFAGETALAQAVLDRAVTLNPNVAMAWVAKGWVHALRDQPEQAIDAVERGLRLTHSILSAITFSPALPTAIWPHAASKTRSHGPTAPCTKPRATSTPIVSRSPRWRISAASTRPALSWPACWPSTRDLRSPGFARRTLPRWRPR